MWPYPLLDWKDFIRQPSMYEVGAFFSSHKMCVRRMKNKLRQRKLGGKRR